MASRGERHSRCFLNNRTPSNHVELERSMDLNIWIPAMVILGLVTMGLMFAFVVGCDRV